MLHANKPNREVFNWGIETPVEDRPEELDILRFFSKWRYFSFPNGSSYHEQYLPEGAFEYVVDLGDGEYEFAPICHVAKANGGNWEIIWPDGQQTCVHAIRRSVGSGADFGASFCTRDQALTALVAG